jgi:hypothetical protein
LSVTNKNGVQMQGKKLEALLRQMLSDLLRLSSKADQLRQSLRQIDQIDLQIMELQHAIARIAHHNRVDPFSTPSSRPTRPRQRS